MISFIIEFWRFLKREHFFGIAGIFPSAGIKGNRMWHQKGGEALSTNHVSLVH